MKNLIVALTLIFSLGICAQTKSTSTTREITTTKITPEMSAKKDVATVSTIFPIDSKTQTALQGILTSKYEILYNNKDLSSERKTTLSESISSQIESVLGKAIFAKIKTDQVLYESLVN